MAAEAMDWESGIFDCFEDASTCCYGCWCCPFLACTVSRRFGEKPCLPLCDILCTAAGLYGFPTCVSPVALSLRVAMRNRFGIKGSICGDILVSYCCVWCAWCQMHRELKFRKKTPTVIDAGSAVVQQPAPAGTMWQQPAAPAGTMLQPAPAGTMWQQPAAPAEMMWQQPVPAETMWQPAPAAAAAPQPATAPPAIPAPSGFAGQ